MPVMDGISCVKNIRNFQEKGMIKSHVPVIAVTANARKDQILRSLEAGMVRFALLLSPFSLLSCGACVLGSGEVIWWIRRGDGIY